MDKIGHHAVVIGASMSGLLMARALLDCFEQVTLLERDAFPDVGAHRKGVPQDRHAHGLLASGCRVIENFFPGIVGDFQARGIFYGDVAVVSRMCIRGHRLHTAPTGVSSMSLSRPLLEGVVRQRLLALPGLRSIERCNVLGPIADGMRVRGVRIQRRAQGGVEEDLQADLVVDASGRGSHTPAWLRSLGYETPVEERVRVDIGYTSVILRRTAEQGKDRGIIVGAAPPNRRCGVIGELDADRWIVTVAGYLGDHAPATHAGVLEFARGLPAPDVAELLESAEPLGDPVPATYPWSQRRRYELLTRFPEGLLVVGDALCSFNPIYAQGMSVAALEAELLPACLSRSPREAWRTFFQEAARIIDTPWAMAVGGDLAFPEVVGPRTLESRVMNAYLGEVILAARTDPAVHSAFVRVAQLCDAPSALFAPHILGRIARSRAESLWVFGHVRTPRSGVRLGSPHAGGPTASNSAAVRQ